MANQEMWLLGGLIVLNAPLYYVYMRLLFDDLQGLVDAIVFWIKPDMWSFLQGEWGEDIWNELKLAVFIAMCAFTVYIEFSLVKEYLPT